MKQIQIIIPCYNEEENLNQIAEEVFKSVKSLNYEFSLLFIDDGSVDNSLTILTELMKKRENINVISFSRNFGKEATIAAALHYCKTDAAIIIDADLQHPPNLIPALIKEWENGSDIIDAVKIKRPQGLLKNLTSILFNKIMCALTDMDFSNAADFKLLSRKAIMIINSLPEKSRFFRGLTNWVGLNHSKIEFETQERIHGESKWNWIMLFKLSIDAITSYSSKPLHVVTVLGIVTLLFSILLGLLTLYNKLFANAATGFTTVIVIILLFSSIIMISIGIVGMYISKIFIEVKNRPIYIVEKDFIKYNSSYGKKQSNMEDKKD